MRPQFVREAEDEQQWALAAAKTHALASLMDEEKARMRREALKQLNEDRHRQVAVQDANRRVASGYGADIGDEWWGKFNRGTR